jgi:hypothetical protein
VEHIRTDRMVSHLLPARRCCSCYVRREHKPSLAAQRCISFDRFCCVPMDGVPLNYKRKTEYYLFFVFRSVSRDNTVIMNNPSLHRSFVMKQFDSLRERGSPDVTPRCLINCIRLHTVACLKTTVSGMLRLVVWFNIDLF